MLNNIHFVALDVFDVHNSFFCHFQSRLFSQARCCSDAFEWLSYLSLQCPTSAINTTWFKHLKMFKNQGCNLQ